MPTRSCKGCRRRQPAHTLVRLVGPSSVAPRDAGAAGALSTTPRGGRGSWACPSASCLERALRLRPRAPASRATALAWLSVARSAAAERLARRLDGLRRRRIDAEDDSKVRDLRAHIASLDAAAGASDGSAEGTGEKRR